MKADIRLIAMDMDGTLLNSQQRISEENAKALREARDQGIKLAICSGRSPGDIAMFALENGLEDCALLSLNGTHCLETPLAAPFCNHVLDQATLDAAMAIMHNEHMAFACYAQNRVVIFPVNGETGKSFWVAHEAGLLAPEILYGPKGLEHVLPRGINKIICLAPDEEGWQRIRRRLIQLERLDVSTSWPLDFELMPLPYGKGTAVSELAAKLGLDASQVMTMGDYDNDISMIEYAGFGVAMANATECIKKAAKIQTLSNDEDGVAYVIRKYALK